MTPEMAIQVLRNRGWMVCQIAKEVGMHRSNLHKAYTARSMPTYENSMKLINLAKSGRKPKERK